MICQARQYSDETRCAPCGLVWDTNDAHPPRCRAAGLIDRETHYILGMIAPVMAHLEHGDWRLERHIDVQFRDLRIFYAERCGLVIRRRALGMNFIRRRP